MFETIIYVIAFGAVYSLGVLVGRNVAKREYQDSNLKFREEKYLRLDERTFVRIYQVEGVRYATKYGLDQETNELVWLGQYPLELSN